MTSSAASHSASSKRACKVRQACDGCRIRKIRCDGTHPCANCIDNSCNCTYHAVPKKTGPKGRRKARLAESRSPAQFSMTVPLAVLATTNQQQLPLSLDYGDSSISGTESSFVRNAGSPVAGDGGFVPSPRVPVDFMMSCLDAFFTHKYPITPILDRRQVQDAIPNLRCMPEMYGLITACCAVMVLSPDIIITDRADLQREDASCSTSISAFEVPQAEFLIAETIRARGYCDYVERPSLTTIQTSFFLFSAFFCLGKDTSAWHYIREAITIVQSLRLHEEASHSEIQDPTVALYARRMFWVLFITERAYALQRHRPLTLQSAIALPSAESSPEEAHILPGLLDLISLFQNFDTAFITMWNVSNDPPFSAPKDYLAKIQQALELALPRVSERTITQQADLLLSREWLKLMVWQLCVSKTLLCSTSPDESMSLRFPVSVARNMVVTTRLLPEKALEANGVGILEKIFDVGCSLADVLSLKAASSLLPRSTMEVSPADYLCEIIHLVGTAAGGSPRHLKILAAKAEECLRPGMLYKVAEKWPFLEESGASTTVLEDESDQGQPLEDLAFINSPLQMTTSNSAIETLSGEELELGTKSELWIE
ncbi:hypothetical protein LI328DRAFT_167895 [Trichoderma asperelloides]|nr:hypothetical protein LI328DRAFT_167895 [Trichoderma asperelloides]